MGVIAELIMKDGNSLMMSIDLKPKDEIPKEIFLQAMKGDFKDGKNIQFNLISVKHGQKPVYMEEGMKWQ